MAKPKTKRKAKAKVLNKAGTVKAAESPESWIMPGGKEIKQVPTTPQGIAEIFRMYAEAIRNNLRRLNYQQDHPELPRLYDQYRDMCISNWSKIAKDDLRDCPDFGKLPMLTESGFYIGLVRLAEFCEEAAELLEIKTEQQKPQAAAEPSGGAENEQNEKLKNKKADVQFTYTADFKVVSVNGKPYRFTKNQAGAIRVLWEAHNDPEKVGVDERNIGAILDTSAKNYRLLDTFRQRRKGKKGFHPAWNELIQHIGNHVYRLKIPKEDTAESS